MTLASINLTGEKESSLEEVFSHLKFLYLGGNQLKTLPKECARLKNVRYLNITYNRFQELPFCLGEFERNLRLGFTTISSK